MSGTQVLVRMVVMEITQADEGMAVVVVRLVADLAADLIEGKELDLADLAAEDLVGPVGELTVPITETITMCYLGLFRRKEKDQGGGIRLP